MIRSVNVEWLDGQFNFHNKEIHAVKVHRDNLVYACRQPFNYDLYENIKRTGMRHPLIVIANTKENHEEATIDLSNAEPYAPYIKYLVVYGNQRLLCLDFMDIEEDISIFIADNHWEAILIHNVLNSSTVDR